MVLSLASNYWDSWSIWEVCTIGTNFSLKKLSIQLWFQSVDHLEEAETSFLSDFWDNFFLWCSRLLAHRLLSKFSTLFLRPNVHILSLLFLPRFKSSKKYLNNCYQLLLNSSIFTTCVTLVRSYKTSAKESNNSSSKFSCTSWGECLLIVW